MLRHGIPPLGGVAALKTIDEFLREASIQKEGAGHLRLGSLQLLPIERMCGTVGFDQSFSGAGLYRRRPGRTPLVVDMIVYLVCYQLDGLGEGQVFHLHEEVEHVPTFARRKAMVVAMVRSNMKRRGFLVFKRAQPLQRIGTAGLKLHIFADDFFDRGTFADRLNVGVGDASSGHG